ncbi:MAG: hypothetical protein NTX53_00130 [candidate division WOR-3 bacterium]|nr:hypothetical protein [candidate division WOR-3 bacterium]
MSRTTRLEQLEQECHGRGVKLIYDDLRSEGGLCRLRNGYYLILNRRLASETKARIITDALARVGDCPRMGTVPKTDSVASVTDRVPSPELAAQPLPAATMPVIEERPEPVYEEHLTGVPVAAGVPDGQS